MIYSEISPICKLHEDTKSASKLLEESFLVGDDVGRVNGCKKSNLIKGIIFLSGIKLHHFDLFKGVDLVVSFILSDFDDSTETARA